MADQDANDRIRIYAELLKQAKRLKAKPNSHTMMLMRFGKRVHLIQPKQGKDMKATPKP